MKNERGEKIALSNKLEEIMEAKTEFKWVKLDDANSYFKKSPIQKNV